MNIWIIIHDNNMWVLEVHNNARGKWQLATTVEKSDKGWLAGAIPNDTILREGRYCREQGAGSVWSRSGQPEGHFFFMWEERRDRIHEGWVAWTVTWKSICRIEWFEEARNGSALSRAVNSRLNLAHRCPHFRVQKSDTAFQGMRGLEASDGSIVWMR